jgi:hypothetical protein
MRQKVGLAPARISLDMAGLMCRPQSTDGCSSHPSPATPFPSFSALAPAPAPGHTRPLAYHQSTNCYGDNSTEPALPRAACCPFYRVTSPGPGPLGERASPVGAPSGPPPQQLGPLPSPSPCGSHPTLVPVSPSLHRYWCWPYHACLSLLSRDRL